MPKTQEILQMLQSIVDDYPASAIVWHVVFFGIIAFLFAKWVPSNRLFGIMLSIPLLSVAVFAWKSGNPFNGILFSMLAIFIFIFGLRATAQPVSLSALPFLLVGIILVVFGLIYPHFLKTDSLFRYLYASPAGLIPCPTLSILIGLALIYNGFGSQPITIALIAFGLFYGLFGVLKLAVYLDLFLLLGAATLLIRYFGMVRTSG
jgi:hypothetical protein